MSDAVQLRRLVIRVGKRKTSWESQDVDTIVNTEFKDRDGVIDTQPSVYEVTASNDAQLRQDVVRVVAEHAASFLNDPPKGTRNLDLDGLATATPTPGESKFSFANAHHHEVQLGGLDGLRDLVRRALVDVDRRLHSVSREELLGYAATQLAADDAEWTGALADREAWLRLIKKRQQGPVPSS